MAKLLHRKAKNDWQLTGEPGLAYAAARRNELYLKKIMKRHSAFVFAILLASASTAQNTDGFEEWEYVGEWEVPVGWTVNNTYEVFPCSVKEEEAFSGQYALRLRSYGPSFEGYTAGVATREFYVTPTEGLLALQVKIDSLLSGGFATIAVTGKASNYAVPIGSWNRNTLTNGFEHVEILLEQTSLPDSVRVILTSNTTPGPLGFEGYTEMVVDQLEFVLDVSAQQETPRAQAARIYPMPVGQQATVELSGWDNGQEVQLELLDATGRQVLQANGQAPLFTFQRNGLPAGLYACRLVVDGAVVQAGRVVLQ